MIHHLPWACITSKQLRALASRLDDLEMIHARLGGGVRDRPCLHRIEANPAKKVVAYVSVTKAVEIALHWDEHRGVWREIATPT